MRPAARPRSRDPWFLALAVLVAVAFVLLAGRLVYPDLDRDYPFRDGDSSDWIANGLRLAGEDVRYTGRPPFVPLLVAALERLGALAWLPVLLQALFLGTVLAFYDLAARRGPRWAAFAAALFLLLNHSLQGLALQVMADVPAAGLLFLSTRALLLAGERPALYARGGALAAASALAQPAALLWLPASAVTVAWCRRRDLRSPYFLSGLALVAAAPALWLALQVFWLGTAGTHSGRQWQLVRLHGDSVSFYLWGLLAVLGIPACVLLLPALAAAAKRALARDAGSLFLLALAAGLLAFFVFVYDFNARRFLVYLLWPAALLLAEALGRLPRRLAPWTAGLVVLGSALPLPGAANDPFWLGLWPLPPVYARAEVSVRSSGSAVLMPSTIRAETRAPADLLRECQPCRVWRARAAFAATPRADWPEPARFAADAAALFLYERRSEAGGCQRVLPHLANALRRRAKCLPAEPFEPYWRFVALSRAAVLAPDYALYRARLPGLAPTWLIAATFGGGLAGRLDALAAAGRGAEDSPALGAGRRKAESILGFLAESDDYLAVVPDPRRGDLSQLFLPFLAETTEMVIAEPGQEGELLRFATAGRVVEQRRFGPTLVRRLVVFRRGAGLVSYGPDALGPPTDS
jgi:hypothetical protein